MLDAILHSTDFSEFVGIGAVVLSGALAGATRQVHKWRKLHEQEEHTSKMIQVALFGQAADPPLPAMPGLIASQEQVGANVRELTTRVDAISVDIQMLKQSHAELKINTDKHISEQNKDLLTHLVTQVDELAKNYGHEHQKKLRGDNRDGTR